MTEHLHPEAAKLIDAKLEAQIHWLKSPKWINYQKGSEVLEKIDSILTHPLTHRMPSMLIVGPTNNGKTMILQEAMKRYPTVRVPEVEADQIPLLFLTMPPGPEVRRFYALVLDHVGAIYRPSASTSRLEQQVITVLKAVHLKAIIVDELQNILGGRHDHQRQFLNMLRFLSNELQISFICAGTKEAVRAIQTDDQLANRYEVNWLPEWKDGREFRRFLFLLESILPLKQPSFLYKTDLGRLALSLSEGTIGELINLVVSATIIALKQGADNLTEEHFHSSDYIPPSQRKIYARNLLG